jgi:hypothetical protein
MLREILDGLMRIERMSLRRFCKYHSKGPRMARDKNIEDYPDTMPEDHAQVCRARLANELGVVHYVYDGRVREVFFRNFHRGKSMHCSSLETSPLLVGL